MWTPLICLFHPARRAKGFRMENHRGEKGRHPKFGAKTILWLRKNTSKDFHLSNGSNWQSFPLPFFPLPLPFKLPWRWGRPHHRGPPGSTGVYRGPPGSTKLPCLLLQPCCCSLGAPGMYWRSKEIPGWEGNIHRLSTNIHQPSNCPH